MLDATTGQNGLAQAKAFHESVGLTGIVLTKLDSTAKGGIVFAIEHDLGIPVRFVGVGERPATCSRSTRRPSWRPCSTRCARTAATPTPPARRRLPPRRPSRWAEPLTQPASVRQNSRTTGRRRPVGPHPGRSPTRTVFDSLSDRLRKTLADLTGRGRVSEADVDAAMREIRLALLEADVNFKVVKDFVGRVRERAIGAEILESLTAGQQVVKIVNDELVALLGAGDRTFHLRAIRPSSRWSASRARARRLRPPSSPATSSSRAAGRCSSPRDRTGRPPPTSSRRSARASTSRSIGRPSGPRSSTSPAVGSKPPSARCATS